MKISILSSDEKLTQTFNKVLNEYALKRMVSIDIFAFRNIKNLLNSEVEFDILFVDDYTPRQISSNTPRLVRSVYTDTDLVIISSDPYKVYDAFPLKAHRFLLKPVSPEVIFEALDSHRKEQLSNKFIVAKVDTGFKSFKTEDIMYIEAEGKVSTIHTRKLSVQTSTPYSQILDQLPDDCFFMCHRSFTVNMNYVTEFTSDEIQLIDNRILPLSRRRKMDFYITFNEFIKSHTFG